MMTDAYTYRVHGYIISLFFSFSFLVLGRAGDDTASSFTC